jgi:hypothetical protein
MTGDAKKLRGSETLVFYMMSERLYSKPFVEMRTDRMMRTYTKSGLLRHAGGGSLGGGATLVSVARNIKRRWPNAKTIALVATKCKPVKSPRFFRDYNLGWNLSIATPSHSSRCSLRHLETGREGHRLSSARIL